MATVKVEADQMYDATVHRISFVRRGANRIPFRTIKSQMENAGMIDLSKGFLKTTKTEAPRVVAIALADESLLPVVKDVLKGQFDHVEKSEKGIVVLKCDKDTDLSDSTLVPVQLGESVVLFKGFRPYGMENATYMETIKAQGFMPGISLAADALFNSISTVIYDDTVDKKALVAKMESLVGDFGKYVVGLANDIPEVAFKAEKALAEAKAKVEKDAQAKAKAEADAKAKESAKKAENEEQQEDEDEEQQQAAAVKPEIDTKEIVKSAVEAASKTAAALITKSLAGVTKAVQDLSAEVKGVAKSQADLDAKVTSVAKKADAAVEATGAIVGGDPEEDQEETGNKGKKKHEQDESGIPLTLDTAFQKSVRKSNRFSANAANGHLRRQ